MRGRDGPVEPVLDGTDSSERSATRHARRFVSCVGAVVAVLSFVLFGLITVGVVANLWRIVPVSSGSMEPAIPTWSAVVARPVEGDDLAAGDVVLFHPPTEDEQLMVHRIVAVETVAGGRVFQTRGDANDAPDPWRLRFDDEQVWRVSRVVPGVGKIAEAVSSTEARTVALVLGAGLAVFAGMRWIWSRPKDDDERGGSDAGGSDREVVLDDGDRGGAVASRERSPKPERAGSRVAFWAGNLGVIALVVAVLAGTRALATFTATTTVSTPYGSGVLNAPTTPGCAWTTFLGNPNVLFLIWGDNSPGFTQGYELRRSDTAGGPYTTLGQTTNPLAFSTPPNPVTTPRYYVVRATRGTWTGSNSGEAASNLCSGSVNAVAGNGTAGFSGDGGSATAAQLNTPSGVAVDGSGNVYIADKANSRVRKVTPSGTISTFAGGSGTASACSYTGAVASLRLNTPHGVTVDASGNVYIADTGQNCIRKVDTSGNVTRVAGGGATTTCNSTGAASSVSLSGPFAVAVDGAGAVYVADTGNLCVRKVSGGTYSHVAGGGSTTTCNSTGPATSLGSFVPTDVAVDASGTVYIAENFFGAGCVRKVSGGTYSHVAGGGAGTSCTTSGAATDINMAGASGVAVDASGNVLVADTIRNCVLKIAGGNFSPYAFTGTVGSTGDNARATQATANHPVGVELDSAGNAYVADLDNSRVRKVIF